MEDEFFTINEVSKYLKIPKSTIYKLSQKGQIPSSKIGKQLRFRKSSLDKWLSEKETRSRGNIDETFPTPDTPRLNSQQTKFVLLIDDDELVLKTLARFLKTYGYNVEPAQSGEEALKKIEKASFDLVITDIRMPGVDGIETIKRIREFHRQRHQPLIPEIIITGYIDTQSQREAESLGITDYIYKPFAIPDFIKTVKKKLDSDLN